MLSSKKETDLNHFPRILTSRLLYKLLKKIFFKCLSDFCMVV